MNKHGLTVLVLALVLAVSACSSNRAPPRDKKNDVARVKSQLAVEYMRNGDYRMATAAIEEALQSDSGFDYAWLIRAQIYQYLKVPERAEESFRRALAISPSSAEINNNYGWFLCNSTRVSESLAYFDRAIADPTYPTPFVAYMNKGICSGRLGQYAQARQDLERAIAMAPTFIPAQKELARLRLQEGSANEADNMFRNYQSQVERLSADDLLLGWQIARTLGNVQAASEYEMQLRVQYPYSPELDKISTGNL